MKKLFKKPVKAGADKTTSAMGLVYSDPAPLVLERRMMFDGALAGEVADKTQAAAPANTGTDAGTDAGANQTQSASGSTDSDHSASSSTTGSAPAPGTDGAAPAPVTLVLPTQTPEAVTQAAAQAQQLVSQVLARSDAQALLFSLFHGQQGATPDAAWSQALASLLSGQNGSLPLRVELRSASDMNNAEGAFAAAGPDGKPVIYLNRDWIAKGATQAELTRVLVEEIGHALDAQLNAGQDTPGDEGEAFAAVATGNATSAAIIQADTDYDHATLQIDGQQVAVEMATLDTSDWITIGPAGDPNKTSNDGGWTASAPDLVSNADYPYLQYKLTTADADTYLNIKLRVEKQPPKDIVMNYGQMLFDLNGDGLPEFALFLHVVQENGYNRSTQVDPVTGYVTNASSNYTYQIFFVPLTSSGPDSNTRPNNTTFASQQAYMVYDSNRNKSASNANATQVSGNTYDANLSVFFALAPEADLDADGITENYYVMSFKASAFTDFANYVSNSLPGMQQLSTSAWPTGGSSANPVLYGAAVSATQANSVNGDIGGGAYNGSETWRTIFGINDAPVAKGNSYTTLEDTALTGRNIITNADPVNGSDSDTETAASLLRIASINGSAFVANGTDAGHLAANGWMQVTLAHGTVFIKADGSMDYKPAQDDAGGDSFTYTIQDAQGKASNTATVTLSVTAVNDAPTAVGDTNTAKEAGGVNNGTAGVDPEGNVITGVVSLTGGSDTNKTADNDVEDGTAALRVIGITSASGLVSVNAGANNLNSAYASASGQYGTLRMLADGSYRYIVDNTKAAVQALRSSANTLTESFTYTITDTNGVTATATLVITITGANDAPVAVNDSNTAKESLQTSGAYGANDPQGSTATGNVLNNDTDVDAYGESKSIVGTLASATLTGSTTVGGSTALVFIPGTTFSPVGSGDEAWLEVTIGGTTTYRAMFDANGNQITATGPYNATDRTIPLSGLPATYYDASAPGNRIALSSFDQVVVGFKNSTNTTTETSSGMKKGTVSSSSSTGTTTYSLGSLSGNVAVGMSVTGTGVPADTVITSVVYDFNGNATGVVLNKAISAGVGSTLGFAGAAASTLTGHYGTLVLNADGSYTYTPTANNPLLSEGQSALDVFQYQMKDAAGATSSATLSITVYGSGTNDPNAVNDTVIAREAGGSDNFDRDPNPSGNVLSNDSTPALSNMVIAGRAAGAAADSVLYATAIGDVSSSSNTITLASVPDTLAVGMLVKFGSGIIPAGTIVTDISGNVITLSQTPFASVGSASLLFVRQATNNVNDSLVLTGQYGQLRLKSDGSYTYTVDDSNPTVQALHLASQTLTDVFTYRVTNGVFSSRNLLSDAATLTITIKGANDTPTGVADSAIATETGVTPGSSATGNVLANDIEIDGGDPLRVVSVLNLSSAAPFRSEVGGADNNLNSAYATSVGAFGTLRILSDGSYQYDVDNSNAVVQSLDSGQTMIDYFLYFLEDSTRQGSATGSVGATLLTITANTDGVSVGDRITGAGIPEDTFVTFVTRDGSGIVTAVGLNQATTAALDAASVSFSSGSAAMLSITISGTNDAPVACGNSYTVTEDHVLSGSNIITDYDAGAGIDSDPEYSTLALASVNGLAFGLLADSTDATHSAANGWKALTLDKGTLYLRVDGTTDYKPFANANGSESFTYTVTDGSAFSDAATVTISITPENDAPTIVINPANAQVQESSLPSGTDAGSPYASYEGHFALTDVDGLTDICSITFKDTGASDLTLTVGNGAGQFATLADMVGQRFDTANGTVTLLSYANGDFSYRFTLASQTADVANATETNSFTVEVKDSADASASATVTFEIVDDAPLIDASKLVTLGKLTADESNLATNPSTSAAAIFADALKYGADGAGSASYSLVLNGTVGSGLYAVDSTQTAGKGSEIMLSQSGNVISGKVGSTTYFTISIDNASGLISFDQVKAVWHADSSDANDVASLNLANAADLQLSATFTDGDGDSVSHSVNLGQSGSFRILDDGPAIGNASPATNASITASENGLAGGASQGSADFSIHFNAPQYGADGAGSAGYALRLGASSVATNLYLQDNADTSSSDGDGIGQGGQVLLSMDGNDVVGKVGSSVVLRIAVDASGQVTLTQYAALWHDSGDSYQATVTLDLLPASLTLERSVLDADGDAAKANYDLGANAAFKFQATPVPQVDSIRVNEASPWAVFTVTGASGQWLKLALSDGSAHQDLDASHDTDGSDDFGPGLEYWNGSQWTAYTPDSLVQIPVGDTHLFVRTAINQDRVSEGEETFTLTVSNAGGSSGSGTATIDDQGGGSKFKDAAPPVGGPPPTDAAGPDASYDDDRPLTVNSMRVNEASPWVVFNVKGNEGQFVKLVLADGSANMDTDSSRDTDGSDDYGPALQYWNGSQWSAYTPGSFVQIPIGGGDILRVRTAILNDDVYEGDQTFTLTATNTGGSGATGTATIDDHGGGVKYPDADPSSGVPTDTTNLDDDRPLTVSSRTFNEASPYAVFEVSGVSGQLVSLALGNTASTADKDATLGVDTANAGNGVPLQYFNGTAWVDYTPGSKIAIPGPGNRLLVRTAIVNDTLFEGAETFTLVARNASGIAAEGVATIVDDGSGVVYDENGNPTGNKPDDDRPVPPPKPAAPAPITPPTPAPAAPVLPTLTVQPFLPTEALRVQNSQPIELPSLTLASRIPDQFAEYGTEARFAVPEGTFLSTNPGERLNLAAVMADGRPLPSWLNFNGTTGVFTGKAPAGFAGELQIKVIARDQAGNEVEALFRFQFGEKGKRLPERNAASTPVADQAGAAQAEDTVSIEAAAGTVEPQPEAPLQQGAQNSAPGLPGRASLAQQLREQSLRARLAKAHAERVKRAA